MGDLSLSDVSWALRLRQPVLRLDGRAVSSEAQALVSHVLDTIVLPSLPPQRPTSIANMRKAVEALLAGLLAAQEAEWGEGWRSRPLSNGSFTGETVGRTQFLKALGALERAGMLDRVGGFRGRDAAQTGKPGVDTRLRLTGEALRIAEGFGVAIGNVGQHFG